MKPHNFPQRSGPGCPDSAGWELCGGVCWQWLWEQAESCSCPWCASASGALPCARHTAHSRAGSSTKGQPALPSEWLLKWRLLPKCWQWPCKHPFTTAFCSSLSYSCFCFPEGANAATTIHTSPKPPIGSKSQFIAVFRYYYTCIPWLGMGLIWHAAGFVFSPVSQVFWRTAKAFQGQPLWL